MPVLGSLQAALTGESLPVAVPREDTDGEGSGKKLWSGSIVKVGEAEVLVTETGVHTMIGEAAKSIQESGGKHVGVFEAKIILAGRVLIILTLIAVGSLIGGAVGARYGRRLSPAALRGAIVVLGLIGLWRLLV